MGKKHGCCRDGACTEETCMELPEGKTCGDCRYQPWCKALFSCPPERTSCDYFPRRFGAKEAE